MAGSSVSVRSVAALVTAVITLLVSLPAPARAADGTEPDVADELMFYRDSGQVRIYDLHNTAALGSLVTASNSYSTGWSSITAVELDGGGQDEVMFYRASDGAFRYYDIQDSGSLGAPIRAGSGYSVGWSVITAIDLDGDARDELLFYRASDGTYKYYKTKPDGSLGALIRGGTGYTPGWTSITAVDLDNDGQDEILFYNDEGVYRYYNIQPSGSLGSLIRAGVDYSAGWSIITAVNVDGDRQDELLFYMNDGRFSYYDIRSDASLGSPMNRGTYSAGWTSIAALNIQGDLPTERVARFTTFYDCCQPRVTNIRTIAAEIDGAVVQPGETFSIDAITGPRTSAGGYVPAPYLINGQGACCAVGGGVSQFGTTIHNAVFWGGFDVVTFRPHSGWISRYPLGIEHTLVYQAIDFKFTNDTVTPVTIRTSSTSTSVTVELWGNQGGWRVSGFHPRGRTLSAISVLDDGGEWAKRVTARVTGTAPGLIRIDRTLRRGASSQTETWWWRYVS